MTKKHCKFYNTGMGEDWCGESDLPMRAEPQFKLNVCKNCPLNKEAVKK